MEKFVNLTPHAITVCGRTFEPSGEVARLEMVEEEMPSIAGLPVFCQSPVVEANVLPAPKPGVFYIVSGMVRAHHPRRRDLLSPGRLVRDEDGRVVGCAGLIRNH